jgi:uncharacterized heparinase superfamily protein
MNKLFLYINTIKYLKIIQILYRIKYIFYKPNIKKLSVEKIPLKSKSWFHISLYNKRCFPGHKFIFLNEQKTIKLPEDWNNTAINKLWIYNLHYFDDLMSHNALLNKSFYLNMINCWIDSNKKSSDIGWDPYPLSIRCVNLCKAWLGGLDIDIKIFSSIFQQTDYLLKNLEKHLLGNHYLTNLKAVLFSGLIFNNRDWILFAKKELIEQISEQILTDGANFELSPMYHSLAVVDFLDMYNILQAYPSEENQDLKFALEEALDKMLYFMEIMSHPDGGVSFFNDSVDGIAPKKDIIEDYASQLGFNVYSNKFKENTIIDNKKSGYMCSYFNNIKLIFDASPIGPKYIPGHGHADTLSFELSIGSSRVFVNSGISEYSNSKKRTLQRKTISHNTVEVDEKDSSQVWSSFRVANRANVISRSHNLSNNNVRMRAAHDGYKSFFSGCIHHRELVVAEDYFILNDKLEGSFNNANSYLYFHPDLNINLYDNLLSILGMDFKLECDLGNLGASLISSIWYPEFGKEITNKSLQIPFKTNKLSLKFNIYQNAHSST